MWTRRRSSDSKLRQNGNGSMGNRKSKQVKIIVWELLIGLIVLAAGFFAVRLRGSVIIKSRQAKLAVGEVVSYRQDDKIWADDIFGNSRFTMRSSGCLVTCIASAVSMETGKKITPDILNKIFSENQVYDSEGNIQWAAIDKIEGYHTEVFGEVSEAEIIECLAVGCYPIVRVRIHGFGSFHYVLIVGIEDGEYVCMDPLKNSLTKLTDYLNRVYAVRVVSVK